MDRYEFTLHENIPQITTSRMKTPHIWGFVFAMFNFTCIGVFFLAHGIMQGDPRWMAIPAGCVVALYMTWERKTVHDQSLVTTVQRAPNPPAEQERLPQPEIRPVVLNDNQMSLGNMKFQRNEWTRLAAVLSAHDWHFTRDIVSQSGLFTNITKQGYWREIEADFVRIGFVKNCEVTKTGREWFSQLLPN